MKWVDAYWAPATHAVDIDIGVSMADKHTEAKPRYTEGGRPVTQRGALCYSQRRPAPVPAAAKPVPASTKTGTGTAATATLERKRGARRARGRRGLSHQAANTEAGRPIVRRSQLCPSDRAAKAKVSPLYQQAVQRAGYNEIHCVAQKGDTEAVEWLLRAGRVDPMAPRQSDGATPLWLAARAGHTEIIKLLLAHKHRGEGICKVLNLRDNQGRSPVYIAADSGHVEAIRALLEADAAPDRADREGVTALYSAAARGEWQSVSLLLEWSADANKRCGRWGESALFAAAAGRSLASVAALVGAKADVHMRCSRGKTALHSAAASGHAGLTDILLSAGAQVDSPDLNGATPTFEAAACGKEAAIGLLIRKSAGQRAVALLHGGSHQRPVVAEAPDASGTTPLMVAAEHGHVAVVRHLIRSKVPLEARDAQGRTALRRAAATQQSETVQVLLEAGAEVDAACTVNGWSSLHQAAYKGNAAILEILLHAGAAQDLSAADGRVASDLAREAGHPRTDPIRRSPEE